MSPRRRALSDPDSSEGGRKAKCAKSTMERSTNRPSRSRRQAKRDDQRGRSGVTNPVSSAAQQTQDSSVDLQPMEELTDRVGKIKVRSQDGNSQPRPPSSYDDLDANQLKRRLRAVDEILSERNSIISHLRGELDRLQAETDNDALLRAQEGRIDDLENHVQRVRVLHEKEKEQSKHELQQLKTTTGSHDVTHSHQIVLQQQDDILALREDKSRIYDLFERSLAAAANEARISAMQKTTQDTTQATFGKDDILLSDIEDDGEPAQQTPTQIRTMMGLSAGQATTPNTFNPDVATVNTLFNVNNRAEQNREALRNMRHSSKKAERALAEDYYKGCYERAKQQQIDYWKKIERQKKPSPDPATLYATMPEQHTSPPTMSSTKSHYYLTADRNDYILINLKEDGLTPIDTKDIEHEIKRGTVYGCNGQKKYKKGRKLERYENEAESWRYKIFDKLQDVSGLKEDVRRESLEWLYELVGEALAGVWRKERPCPPLGNKMRFHSWVLNGQDETKSKLSK